MVNGHRFFVSVVRSIGCHSVQTTDMALTDGAHHFENRQMGKHGQRITITCKHCNKLFEVQPHQAQRIFCSATCRNAHGTRTNRINKTCLTCGKDFEIRPFEQDRKYCSRACANASNKKPVITKTCLQCGQEFSYSDYGRESYFCSKACQLKYVRRKPHICPHCKKTYIPKKHTDQKYCSPQCQAKAQCSQVAIECEACGKKFSVIESKAKRTKYCSKKCQMLSMFSSCDERLVVKIISELLNEAPIKQHTWDWLTNPESGRPLYVDAYFPQHNLVIEYDGKQHRKFIPFYHKTHQQFTELQRRDRVKERLLKQLGISLIRITSKEPKTIKHIATRLHQFLAPQ